VVETEVPEPSDRTEAGCSHETGLDLFEVTVIAERSHGGADSGIDGTVCPLGYRVGDNERFEEQG
jgi:hypothetical protein